MFILGRSTYLLTTVYKGGQTECDGHWISVPFSLRPLVLTNSTKTTVLLNTQQFFNNLGVGVFLYRKNTS